MSALEGNSTSTGQEGTTNIPTFLLKLVSLLNDESNHQYVDWNPDGSSFIVKDQVQFSKIVLPKYFKHNKFASFVRQLNMYGFRKITSLTQSGLNAEAEEIEFYHYLFLRGEESLLEHIKRKVYKPEDTNRRHAEDVTKVLDEVKQMKGHQENVNSRLSELKQENEDLWREVVNLRQKHSHQQRVVNKLIQFLVNLVHQHGMGVKRKVPLMIEDGSSGSANYPPDSKYQKTLLIEEDDKTTLALEQPPKPTVSFPPSVLPSTQQNEVNAMANAVENAGPFITEVTSPILNRNGRNSQLTLNTASFLNDAARDFQDETIPATPAFDVNEYIESTLSPPEVALQSTSVTFPDELEELVQPVAFSSRQASNVQSRVSDQQSVAYRPAPLQISTSYNAKPTQQQNVIAPYEPPRSPRLSPIDLNSHVDLMQNNLESIHSMLFNNDQVELDYGLIQELFGTSPDIMPPADETRANAGTSDITGNEVVLHTNSGSKIDNIDNDFDDLSKYL